MNKLKTMLSKKIVVTLLLILGITTASFSPITLQPQQVSASTASELSAQIKALEEESARYQAEAERMRHQASSLQNTVRAIGADKSALEAQLNVSQSKFDQLQVKIKETEQKMGQQKEMLGGTLAKLYVDSSISPLEMLASSKSIGDFMDKQQYRSAIQDKVQRSIKEVKSLKEQLGTQKKETEQVIKDQEAQRIALATKEAEQGRLLAATRGEESRFQQLSAEAEQRRKEAFAALESLNTSNLNVAATGFVRAGDVIGYVGNTGMTTGPHLHLEARVGGAVTNPNAYSWQQPTSGPITQGFGNPSPWYVSGYHPGIDYGPAEGTPIRAVADGTLYRGCTDLILGPGYSNAYGYMAIIEHSGGVQSLYGHMQAGPDGGACDYGYFQF